jgi:hypothetical protein
MTLAAAALLTQAKTAPGAMSSPNSDQGAAACFRRTLRT